MIRTIRIVGTMTVLSFLFRLSQQLAAVRGDGDVPGYTYALGAVSLLFLIRAIASESAASRVPVSQRDILWGLCLGSFLSMLARVLS